MNDQVMDASALDELEDYDLTDEVSVDDSAPADDSSSDTPADTSSDDSGSDIPTGDSSYTDDDFTTEVLRLKGISDPNRIMFEDESGAIIERRWDDLTDNERLNILASNEDPERDLEDNEIALINQLRQYNLTPQQYVQAIQENAARQAVAQYQSSQAPTYEIDSLSDDELFALDFLERVGADNVTDEELQQELENAKQNEALYAKQIEGLRTSYKQLEDQQKYNAEQVQRAQIEQNYRDFSNVVLDQIGNFNSFANQDIELSTEDKNDIANYLLTRRESGISDFYTDIQDPSKAVLAAFWMLRGPEVVSEMENQVRAAYQRGYNVGRNTGAQLSTPRTPRVVVQPQPQTKASNTDFQSAFGLEDEDYLNN